MDTNRFSYIFGRGLGGVIGTFITCHVHLKYMATEKIDVSPHVKRILELIKDAEGHLNMDSVVRSRLSEDDWELGDCRRH